MEKVNEEFDVLVMTTCYCCLGYHSHRFPNTRVGYEGHLSSSGALCYRPWNMSVPGTSKNETYQTLQNIQFIAFLQLSPNIIVRRPEPCIPMNCVANGEDVEVAVDAYWSRAHD